MRTLLKIMAIFLSISACQNNAGSGGNKAGRVLYTDEGYSYVIHNETNGNPGQVNDHLFFHAQWRNGNNIIMSTRMGPGQQVRHLQIPADQSKLSSLDKVILSLAEGDSATVTVPLEGQESVPPGFENATEMTVDFMMVDIQTDQEFQAERQKEQQGLEALKSRIISRRPAVADSLKAIIADYKAGALEDQIQTAPSGLKYLIMRKGQGGPALKGRNTFVNFYGMLPNGQRIDDSFQRGLPFGFALGSNQVVQGWNEGIGYLNKGGTAILFVPPDLGYGATGSTNVPPNAELIFFVELFDIQ